MNEISFDLFHTTPTKTKKTNKSTEKPKEKFERLEKDWYLLRDIKNINIQSASNFYTDLKPYKDIVKMGKVVLPYLIDRLDSGEYLYITAVMKIMGISYEDCYKKELDLYNKQGYLSDQKISAILLDFYKTK